jgi:hypothetical protein
MTTTTLPPVTPAFRDAVRELAMQIGWRNVAKRIAYGPTETVVPSNGNGRKSKRLAPARFKDNHDLPGPNPPRNKAGGFTCPAPGGYERSGPGVAYSQYVTAWNSDIERYPKGSVVRTGRHALACPPYVFKAQYDPTLNTEETWREAEERERAEKQEVRDVVLP